jgi:pimeloyl-ACP methyl ester carboxylesterase
MIPKTILEASRMAVLLAALPASLLAQQPPYDVFPPADPPYYRVRYEPSTQPGELAFPVNYTVWIPADAESLRGVIVHQHGCGEGSCRSGLTGAYDLHWQALAKRHDCALLSPSYEQLEGADCQLWCDPRNGSGTAFQKALVELGSQSGHPELSKVPWALWGHSGGGHWAGGMVLLHPERVAAAWLRSGVPLLKPNSERSNIKHHTLPEAALKVPMMCNLGTQEGVTVKDGRFASVWPANELFFREVRSQGGLIGVAVDPLTAHECGNQRYFAVPWLDACLSARLRDSGGETLNPMPTDEAWLADLNSTEAVSASQYSGDSQQAVWLPNESVARAWMHYVRDTSLPDTTPPPVPTNPRLQGNVLTWEAEADLESGLARFLIERDGQFLASVPEEGQSKNPFGRPIFVWLGLRRDSRQRRSPNPRPALGTRAPRATIHGNGFPLERRLVVLRTGGSGHSASLRVPQPQPRLRLSPSRLRRIQGATKRATPKLSIS